MKTFNPEEIIKMKPMMSEMLKKGGLGPLMQFRAIIKMSDSEIEENIDHVNKLICEIPLSHCETMRKKYNFDLGRRNFVEEVDER